MLVIDNDSRIKVRSTGRMAAKAMALVIGILASSDVLYRFDLDRSNGTALKYSAVQMFTVIFYKEIKHLTYEGLHERFDGRGGQIILKNLGMPRDEKGRYFYPSDGQISDFRNHTSRGILYDLEQEMADHILDLNKKEWKVFTFDSTPLEANRYSKWAESNGHYRIKMAKDHIVMLNGVPLYHRLTNGARGDNPELSRTLERFDGTRQGGCFLADGAYDTWDGYLNVYLKTGIVMCANQRENLVFHREASWKNILRRYNRLHALEGFVPSSTATPDFIIRFLASHGEAELAGWFLRNLDFMRGKKRHIVSGRVRHVCETLHRAMKRWVNFDVRGLHSRYVGCQTRQRLYFCQILCLIFVPYDIGSERILNC